MAWPARQPNSTPREQQATIEPVLGLLLALTSLVVVVTCSTASRQATPVYAANAVTEPQLATSPTTSLDNETAPGPETVAPAVDEPHQSALARFFAGLDGLADGKRQDHVRIAWLGDSHTAADLWTHSVRQALQARFGVGGPGFFHLGLKHSRHSQVKIDVQGSWQRQPAQPARTQPFSDGVLGLGGVRAVAGEGALCKAKLYAGVVKGTARWRLYYRLPKKASFLLQLGEHVQTLTASSESESLIQEVALEVAADAELVLRRISGAPELFGGVVEGSESGLLIDTLGINGARARTPLAWDAAAWQREFKRRNADLVVLAYGTNEVFEQHAVTRYVNDYQELVERIRQVKPSVDCLVIGPTDVQQAGRHSHPRVLEVSQAVHSAAAQLGCMYVGAHQLMGGPGSYAEWQTSTPQLAGADGVHLTVSGYRELGALTADFLLATYQQYVAALARGEPLMLSGGAGRISAQ